VKIKSRNVNQKRVIHGKLGAGLVEDLFPCFHDQFVHTASYNGSCYYEKRIIGRFAKKTGSSAVAALPVFRKDLSII
jgi:hypothetical protein